MTDPRDQSELATLVAELRRARQHHLAEQERLAEIQKDFEDACRRAAELLEKRKRG